MMKTVGISVMCALCLAAGATAAWAQTRKGFTLHVRSALDDERRTAIRVTAHVPYTNLVFLKKDEGFEAQYRLYIRIFDKTGKNMLDSVVPSKRESTATYEDTRSPNKSSTVVHEVAVEPGDYVVRCTIHVSNTHLAYADEAPVTVSSMSQAGVGVSKPLLFALPIDTSRSSPLTRVAGGDDDVHVEQTESTKFSALDQQPAFQFDVYLEKAASDSTECVVAYEVVDVKKTQMFYGRQTILLSQSDARLVVSFNVDEWDPGPYVFRAKATVHHPTRSAAATADLDLEYTRAMLTKYFAATVGILAIIGTDDEVRQLEKAPERERGAVWAAFWARRDPTPGTAQNEALDEHWVRVRYANDNFKTSEPGWRTDRGRIYIRYGEPDETEIRSEPNVQGQYLVWRYYEDNLMFVFYDRFGLGEYILSNSSTF
jgi:GWxTD domain-containing protein